MTPLTPRQLEILARLADPDEPTYRSVAHDLGVAESTIRNQVETAHQRLEVHTTAGAWARLGWLVAPTPDEARAMGVDARFTVDP